MHIDFVMCNKKSSGHENLFNKQILTISSFKHRKLIPE